MSDTPESPPAAVFVPDEVANIICDELVVCEVDPPFNDRLVAASIVGMLYEAGYDILSRDRGIHVETYDREIATVEDGMVREYRWRVVHENTQVMGSGEGYADKRDRDRAVAVLFPGVPTEEVEG